MMIPAVIAACLLWGAAVVGLIYGGSHLIDKHAERWLDRQLHR